MRKSESLVAPRTDYHNANLQPAPYFDYRDKDQVVFDRDGMPIVQVSDAMRLLGVTKQRVYQLRSKGKIKGTKIGGHLFIEYGSIIHQLREAKRWK